MNKNIVFMSEYSNDLMNQNMMFMSVFNESINE